jgi:hypothetical protein
MRKNTLAVTVSHHPPEAPEAELITRTFGTSPAELSAMRAWLLSERVDHVALKATYSYWKTVFNILEDTFTTWVIDPVFLKTLPGRGTVEKDPAWLAELLRQGLLKPGFVPKHVRHTLRDLVHYRKSLMDERDREVTRIRKLLGRTNLPGQTVSGWDLARRTLPPAFPQEETGPRPPAKTADPVCAVFVGPRTHSPAQATGDGQLSLLARQLEHLAYLDRQIDALDEELTAQTRPFREARKLS